MNIGAWIRDTWDELFYSSLVQRLEQDLMLLRTDMQQLRQDKDGVIADLRAEKALLTAKIGMYELNINRRVGIDPTAKRSEKPSFASFKSPQVKTSWQAEQEAHEAQIEKELAEEREAEAAALAAKK
jgi:hypothetical protein